jgi:hypothetical protein
VTFQPPDSDHAFHVGHANQMPIARDLALALPPSRFVQRPQKSPDNPSEAGFAAARA